MTESGFWDSSAIMHNGCSDLLLVECTGNPNLVMALAGNKADLASKKKIEAEV